jgi:serine/threonine-protein kinase
VLKFELSGSAQPVYPPPRPPPGAFGQYVIGGTIPGGGMARVYKAQAQDGTLVAIKVPLPEYQDDEQFVARFMRERDIGIKLRGRPNIIYVFDPPPGQLAIVMEYAEGGSLRDWMRPGAQLPFSFIRGVAQQCCAGLACAHAEGVVHRDIKPENILFDRNSTVKIADFGIAHQMTRKTIVSGQVLGAPYYMSPEQAEGREDIDARSDIYSLAVVIYEMCAGQVPFTGEHFYAVLSKHRSEIPPPPGRLRRDIPKSMEQAILRGLEKSPAQRYARVEELAQAVCAT